MTKGTKTALVLLVVGGLAFLAYKFSKKSAKSSGDLPSVDVMREELWQSFVKKYPASQAYKQDYLNSEAFNNVDFMIAWYRAMKSGEPTFSYNNMTWDSQSGMGA